ncbi:hypothetical protein H4R19_001457 [Coemansia spiralis]|nr:hypothetical protein H4R19_001457 [Coemansia spiralis]
MFVRSQEERQSGVAAPVDGAAARPKGAPQRASTTSEQSRQPLDAWFAGGVAEMPPAEPCGLFSLEADDSLIQELLAGIPSTAWLPTDPLTSEDWFPDPSSSVITQDYSVRSAEQPCMDAAGEETLLRVAATARAEHANSLASSMGTLPLPPPPSADASSSGAGASSSSSAAKTPRLGAVNSLDATSSQALHATPDARLMAGVRSKRGTPLMSRNGPKRGNPLSGFAKKHSIAYPVGNQMAILSPELLSSSPPNAAQLRKNPYKYYSPPKHLGPRPAAAQAKGRNLMLGSRGPRATQLQPHPAVARRQRAVSGASTHSAQSHTTTDGVPGAQLRLGDAARNAAKWDIGQDKLLLRGVRYHRWRDGLPARDPSRFVTDDWEQIAVVVSAGGMPRSARQCRRRWAVMYSHLGSAIMDFVDSTPTPQSSAQSTPAPHGSAASGAPPTGPPPRHARNLQLAALPQSSPPLAPGAALGCDAVGRPPPAVSARPAAPHEPKDSTPLLSLPPNLGLDLASLLAPAEADLQSLDVANRWAAPGYCQLLTDIVHAITNPGSRAADVVRNGVATTAKVPAEQPTHPPGAAASKKAKSKAVVPTTGGGAPGDLVAELSGMLSRASAMSGSQGIPHSAMPRAAGVPADQLSVLQSLGPHASTVLPGPLAAVSSTVGTMTAHPAAGVEGALDLATSDQDMSVYMEFIRSLTADPNDLGGAWSSLFEDPGSSRLSLGAGTGAGSLAMGAAPTVDRRPLQPATAARGPQQGRQPVAEDDDANDGDFVLDDSEDVDDDDDDDYGDDDGEQPAGAASDESPRVGTFGALGRAPVPGAPHTDTDRAHSWELTLRQLGLDADASPAMAFADALAGTDLRDIAKLPGTSGAGNILADPLIQQLMQGVSIGNGAPGTSGTDASTAAWLSSMAVDTATLPPWDAAGRAQPGDRNPLLAAASGANGAVAVHEQPGRTPRRGSREASDGRAAGQRVHSQQSHLQRLMSDIVAPSKRGAFKAPRRMAKKPASASIVKALSAAVMMDMDGFGGLGSNAIDTEMSGLYQDALQEGEEIGVQEESLNADNCEYLFTADQMSQLREQQMHNFQLVMQAFLISCTEIGPHTQRARHWKKQLDQLALWHSLGTRETPSDLMSADGLGRFGSLIASAERQRASTGVVGMTECGRFAPNPASFFAIPGITAVIPDIYEAVDEIHRATQLSGEHDAKSSDGSGDAGAGGHRTAAAATAAAATAAEVRSFDRNMDFTAQCQCTAIAPEDFKSALMLGSVFPRMYLQMRNGKRKAEEEAEAPDDKMQAVAAGSGGAARQMALLPAGSSRTDGSGDSKGLALPPAMKPLAPLAKATARRGRGASGKGDSGRVVIARAHGGVTGGNASAGVGSSGNSSSGGGLPVLMPMVSSEGPPAYTQADVRAVVEEMKSQMRAFRRDIHRVPRTRRRIFVQGDDGVPRLDWMKMKIDPLLLPPAMHFLLAPLLSYSGFQEALLPQIVAVRKPKNRIHFLDTEDALLFLGLRLFGLEDVASMRVHLLPCKTASQLRNRMNNLRARRAPQNPVKEYCLRRITPFTLEEDEILRVGVLAYGDEFQQMNQSLLVNRPLLALTHVWQHVRGAHDVAPPK